jgi:hypothetical protein
VGRTLCEFKPQELSNMLWSFANVAPQCTEVFKVPELN